MNAAGKGDSEKTIRGRTRQSSAGLTEKRVC